MSPPHSCLGGVTEVYWLIKIRVYLICTVKESLNCLHCSFVPVRLHKAMQLSEPHFVNLLAFKMQRCVQPASPSCVCRFINARRRILQPMLDASSSETPKAKKKTPQNRPLQRFWPDSIAAGGGTQQQVAMPDGKHYLCCS